MATLLYSDQLSNLTKVPDHRTGKTRCTIPIVLVYAPTWQGGLGCPPPGVEAFGLATLPKYPVFRPSLEQTGIDKMTHLMPQRWIDWVKRKMPNTKLAERALVKACKLAIYADLIRAATPKMALRTYAQEWASYGEKLDRALEGQPHALELKAFADRREGLFWHQSHLRDSVIRDSVSPYLFAGGRISNSVEDMFKRLWKSGQARLGRAGACCAS